ncbi:conserved hypothetical protein [Candidatus Sulfopaludibacter sp. SbA4]|nr:conserved hypothetical protein [Candidatus Sulfopaludibacter sp. SbA4]
MNPRTCLLCGKPLSRIWVGAGEDFCSREHRNQYRLRRGMDRLLEANKVASLMRRREQPKPISATLQAGTAAARVTDPAPIRLSGSGIKPRYPASKWSPPVRIPAARSWVQGYRTRAENGEPRECGILRGQDSGAARVVLSKGTRQIEPPGATYLEKTRQPRPVRTPGRHGSALRVSASAGFKLPAKRGRHFPAARHPLASMRWPDRLLESDRDVFDRPADSTILRVSFPVRDATGPESPEARRRADMVWPGTMPGGVGPVESARLTLRGPEAFWSKGEAAAPRPIAHGGQERAAADLVRLPQRLAYGSAARQVAQVTWEPQDSHVGYSPAMSASAERTPATVRTKMEERFDSGWKNWVGGVEDWCVDAAGVRTGSLALFTPSLDLRDYEMEFLTRIENRSVVWVFRASNFSEYHMCSIKVSPNGGYDFKRRTVIGGMRGPAVTAPIRKVKAKTALTVRLRAAGNEFTVWVDDQSIDNWTENRLPIGGIGFMGGPDDRARIYWVRVSPVAGPAKELPKR